MKIAQVKDTKYDYQAIKSEEDLEFNRSYIRLSEWLDVRFIPRQREKQIADEIAALDTEHAETVERFTKMLTAIAEKRAKLLAIGYDSASSAA